MYKLTVKITTILLVFLFSFSTIVSADVNVETLGFSIFIEEGEETAGDLILTNDGEEDIGFTLRLQKVRREEDGFRGPLRAEAGELIQEIDLDYHGCLGLSYDAENRVMWAVHTLANRIVGYQWNGEEITETVSDFRSGNYPEDNFSLGCGYYDEIIFTSDWGDPFLKRYSVDGNFRGAWMLPRETVMGIAVENDRGYMYLLEASSCDLIVRDVENNFAHVARIENLLDGADYEVARMRLTWAPEHENGHLWVSWRPNDEDDTSFAWQVAIDEDWNWELIQSFYVETDNRSFGIGHDGENLWVSTFSQDDEDIHTLRIVHDGYVDYSFISFSETEGVILTGDVLDIEYYINPEEFEQGVHETILLIEFDDEELESIEISVVMSLDNPTTTVTGVITGAAENNVVEGATIEMDYYLMTRYSDDDGTFDFNDLPPGEYILSISHPDFHATEVEIVIEDGDDDIALEISMLQAIFSPNVDEISQEIGEDGIIDYEFTVVNEGTGLLNFNAYQRLLNTGDMEPWEFREDVIAFLKSTAKCITY